MSTTLNEQATALRRLTEEHSFHFQHRGHALWERTPSGSPVGEGDLDGTLDALLRREGYAFTTRWETLTRNQQRFLRGVAEAPGAAPFAAEFVQAHGLRTPSNAQRAAESLLRLDLIDREGGGFVISDRFFRLWIRRM